MEVWFMTLIGWPTIGFALMIAGSVVRDVLEARKGERGFFAVLSYYGHLWFLGMATYTLFYASCQ